MRLAAAVLFAAASILAPALSAQTEQGVSTASVTSGSADEGRPAFLNHSFFWTEQFNGSRNSEGEVMSVDSSVGWSFSQHFGVDAGVPIYFVRGTSTSPTSPTTSTKGFGDAYFQGRFSFANPVLNYKTVLTG